ncbi:SDR family NAD(P)-dependent oxidoreductase [Ruegeria sp. HKCCD6428]|uniref:SDR family NAD(P)-dependent oxidoreductase n=1 Tax=Ruegeria sp. HKCCD6428 TaxID=2683002 RepID=UPI0014915142|nr:SDR family NAD(P)-dependent oxidoreductase [Ruegeria sp. HKCCD6428]NOC82172.1 SDR family NAD(P)-dependent oxidoreductase [Ruegeria sp. HKCCD6428]
MPKTILITGATDGIGLLTAKTLAAEGHRVLLHGRSSDKLKAAAQTVGGNPETFRADLSDLDEAAALADAVRARHDRLDVLINNAGVYKTPHPRRADGMDVRFVVNALTPHVLTRRLLPIIPAEGRVVNLSSAAQAPVDVEAMHGKRQLSDMEAYAQSKLAITIWSREMARAHPKGPVFVAVNPGSLLASKMVREGFGMAGNDLAIGADILRRAALSDEFANASGLYFDNDSGHFADPHSAAADRDHAARVKDAIATLTGGGV